MQNRNHKRVLLADISTVDDPRSFSVRIAEELCDKGEFRFVEQEKQCFFEAESSVRSLDRILLGIERASVYSNEFEGLIAIDVSELESCAGESYVESFMRKLEKHNDRAVFLFFANPNGRIANVLSSHFADIETNQEMLLTGGIHNA